MQTETYIENGVTIHNVILEDSDLASVEVKNQRKAICIECNSYNQEENSCSSCGCIADTLMTYTDSKCPEGFW